MGGSSKPCSHQKPVTGFPGKNMATKVCVQMRNKARIILLTILIVSIVAAIGVYAQEEAAGETTIQKNQTGMIALSASIAIAVPGLAAAFGLSMATSAIAGAGAERPEIIEKFFIFIVFMEAIAIYGLVVAIFIIMTLPGH